MALEHTARGAARRREARSGPATLCKKGPRDRQILAGSYAAKCFRRRGGAPRCSGSGRMKLGKLGLPRPTAPNGAGTQPAWHLPTPSCEFETRYPLRERPRDRHSRRTTRRSALRRRGGAPRCAGSGRMKLGKLDLPRPTAPNGAGTHPAWRLPTGGVWGEMEFKCFTMADSSRRFWRRSIDHGRQTTPNSRDGAR